MIDAPFELRGGVRLANRLVKSSMTESLGDEQGNPSESLVRLFRRFAHSGAGLLLTGNVVVDERHAVRAGDVVVTLQSDVQALAVWAEAAHEGGAKVMVQVNHAGRQTPRYLAAHPLAPSPGRAVKFFRNFGEPRAATAAELEDIVTRFGDAAEVLERAGFDGVQVHAAHGYLLNQFLSPLVNRRTDAWGGALEDRARLLLACVREVRRRVSPSFLVGVKLNTSDFQRGGFAEDEALQVVGLLDAEGIDLLELSGGTYEQGASFGDFGPERAPAPREAYFLDFARGARARTRTPLLLTGGFRTRAVMEAALSEGALDLVGLARPLALDPELPRKLLEGSRVKGSASAPRTGWRRLDGFAEMAFYWAQLERMGRGLEPDPDTSAWSAMWRYLRADRQMASRRRAVWRANDEREVRAASPVSS